MKTTAITAMLSFSAPALAHPGSSGLVHAIEHGLYYACGLVAVAAVLAAWRWLQSHLTDSLFV